MGLLYSFFLLFLMNHHSLTATANNYYYCYPTGNFTIDSEYGNNRNSFLTSMPTSVTSGFYYAQSVSYTSTTDILRCLGLCRPDFIGSDSCSICISNSSSDIITHCPVNKNVISWGEDAGCVVRCAPFDFPDTYETHPTKYFCNSSDVNTSFLQQFDHILAYLTGSIAKRAVDYGSKFFFTDSGRDFPKYFATEESKAGDLNLSIYVLGFCLPTLSSDACVDCLQSVANQIVSYCNRKQGATIFTPSCVLRYELYRFYESSLLVPPLPSSPPPSSPQVTNVRKESRKKRAPVIAVVLPIIVVLIVIAFTICMINNLMKRRKLNEEVDDDAIGAENIESCIEFSFNTVRIATNDFYPGNKLGQGGFGAVYKGRLPNGQQIAVKRLLLHSARGEVEFKNEVQLVARLHHKNLIRLLGFCLQGKERILIYELALNGSLDHFLFDPTRRQFLSWEVRDSIIKGIARGMLYLHEESRLRIIHRDLKASNILLNETFTPKISDFGTARLFEQDQGSASRIVGTYGYMAPEYVKHGKISVKVDVFSFGVLLLEILCGRRNSASENSKHIDHLLSKAWTYWTEGKHLKLIDPELLIASGQTQEISRCIHIGLLCVQENAVSRPTMDSIIQMLEAEGCSQSLPTPLKPAYFMNLNIEDEEQNVTMLGQEFSVLSESQQTSLLSFPSSGFSSVNEASITQPYPEPR